MPARVHTAVQHLRRAVLSQDGAGRTDGELLESFLAHGDGAAFGALVRRHGPMVLGVCSRVVRNHHDAEDAFQATFLVLARKAASVKPREMVANWLHGVAYRTAFKARATAAKRRGREKQVTVMPEPEATRQEPWHDLRPLIDQELSRLPETYRLPILLCCLEGRSIAEASRQLGWPQGTFCGRLARGRKMLAGRLARRGLALSGGPLAGMLPPHASAGTAAALIRSTARAAGRLAAGQAACPGVVSARVTALTEGVVRAMSMMPKVKVAAALLLTLLALGSGAGVLSRVALGQQRPDGKVRSKPAAAPKGDPLKDTLVTLDRSLWDAFAKGDPSLAQKLYADEFVSFSPYGRFAKKEAVDSFRLYRPAELKIRDVELLRVNKQTAVLTYVYSVKLLTPAGELDGVRKDHRISKCWSQRDGGWVLVFAQDFVLPGGE